MTAKKKTAQETEGRWQTEGFDTFSGDSYSFPGSYSTEAEAIAAGQAQLKAIQEAQSDEESGGQDEGGIQDQVWIIRPDGKRYPL